MKPTADMDHNCIGNGCRFAGCENQANAPERVTCPACSKSVIRNIFGQYSAHVDAKGRICCASRRKVGF